jgi:cell wall-associated NlpC family hydrolase
LASIISLVIILLGTILPPVYARPVNSGKRAEYNRVKAEIDRIDQQLDVSVEEYNTAAFSLSKTRSELRYYSAKLRAAEREQANRRTALSNRVVNIYQKGSLSYLEMLINTKDVNQFLYCLGLVEQLAKQDAQIIAELRESEKKIAVQRAALLKKVKKQKAIVAEIKSKKNKIASRLSERNRLLTSIAEEFSRQRMAEEREQASLRQRIKVSYRLGHGVSVSRGGSRTSVVGLAMDELGKPYSWGAAGPNAFDCSGLTRYVYGRVGISLPHSSRAQYGSGRHVSRDELQPGDLVFFSRGGTISHVGIYIGGGNFVHAPRTGDVVKISSLSKHGGYVGAVRP